VPTQQLAVGLLSLPESLVLQAENQGNSCDPGEPGQYKEATTESVEEGLQMDDAALVHPSGDEDELEEPKDGYEPNPPSPSGSETEDEWS
jgi:hypothetical protein